MTREDENNETTEEMLGGQKPAEMGVKDKYHMTYLLFYGLGTATLVPQNFYTTATDYWMYKFRDPNLFNSSISYESRTELQAQFIANYSIVSKVSDIVFLIVTIAFLRRFHVLTRIITALCGALIMFAMTCFFVQINTDSWQNRFYGVSLAIGFFLSGFCAVFMVSLFEMVAKFPGHYIAPLLSGHSICGMFAALVQIFSLGIGADSTTSGLTYFAIGMIFVFSTLIALLTCMRRSVFFKHYLNKKSEKVPVGFSKEKLLNIFDKLKFYLSSMIIVLGCTIILHPGLMSLVVSVGKGQGNRWNDVFFVPVITFFLYFACDYIGRELAGYLERPKNGIVIFCAAIIRISLVPMMMFCNAQPRSNLPVVFDQDYAYILFTIIFAFTNGYIVNLCVILVPTVTDDDEKKLSLVLILAFMITSLGACSFLSALVVKAL